MNQYSKNKSNYMYLSSILYGGNNKMHELWENTITYGYIVRSNQKDGLSSWNNLKNSILNNSSNPTFEWNSESKKHYDELRNLGVTGDDDDIKDESWEPHHFLIQHGRIIKNNPSGNLQRLLQIAYNAGQFKAELEKNNKYYTPQMKSIYIEKNYDDLNTYIDSDQILSNTSYDDLIKSIDQLTQELLM